MAYADYDFYIGTFHGVMSEDEFQRYSQDASDYIDSVTSHRIYDDMLGDKVLGELIRKACCAAADMTKRNAELKNIAQETVGSYSVSYAENDANARDHKLYETVKQYLGGTGLMYRGVWK